jgi:hypothetical protein
MGFGTENSSNVKVPVVGIYRSQSLNSVWDEISILDIESFRECFGYYTAKDVTVEIPPEQRKLLDVEIGHDLHVQPDRLVHFARAL